MRLDRAFDAAALALHEFTDSLRASGTTQGFKRAPLDTNVNAATVEFGDEEDCLLGMEMQVGARKDYVHGCRQNKQ